MEIKRLPQTMRQNAISSAQGTLPFDVEKEREIQGIGMGVLKDGTPFLTQRGLALLCGVQNAHIRTIGADWDEPTQKQRITIIKDLLANRSVPVDMPYIQVRKGSKIIYAYPDSVCLAILEYYAFEAGSNCQTEAKSNFRALAAQGLREFIYTQVGYSPEIEIPVSWQNFTTACPSTMTVYRRGIFPSLRSWPT
jgi:hypothetical protein